MLNEWGQWKVTSFYDSWPPPWSSKTDLEWQGGGRGQKSQKRGDTDVLCIWHLIPSFGCNKMTSPIIIGYTNILTDSNIEICWTKISLEVFYLWYHLHLLRKSRKQTNIITHVLRQWDFLLLPNALAVAFSTSIWPRTTITTY